MSNTIKTLTAGDITREALSILHNKLTFIRTINRQYDDRFARSGAKNGGYLEIREPNQFTIREGAVMDTQDVTEETQQLVLATQRGVDINFSSVELTLSMDDFKARILTPAMTRLAAEVEKLTIENCYPYVYNFENTTFGTKPLLADVLACRAVLQQGLAPDNDRYALVDALAANAIITDGKSLFHAADSIEKQYKKGILGEISGLQFNESEMAPRHTNGSRSDSTPVTNIALVANGDTTLVTTGAGSVTIKKGDVFTIDGVYAVNPETKVAYPHLQQFAVTADITCDSTDTLAITPTIYKSGAKQNVSHAAWSGSEALVFVAAGGSGTASTIYTNSLVYQKDAFTFVSADLEMPKGVDFAYRAVNDGISLRIVRNYDIVNDKFPCRIDVLFGSKAIRPAWAVRMCS
jgi:hypothetical protein